MNPETKGTVKGRGKWKGTDWNAITRVGIKKLSLREGKPGTSLLLCILAVTTLAQKFWGGRELGKDHPWCCNLPQRCFTSKPAWALQLAMNHSLITMSPFSFKVWKHRKFFVSNARMLFDSISCSPETLRTTGLKQEKSRKQALAST